jgi:hypothetical protein
MFGEREAQGPLKLLNKGTPSFSIIRGGTFGLGRKSALSNLPYSYPQTTTETNVTACERVRTFLVSNGGEALTSFEGFFIKLKYYVAKDLMRFPASVNDRMEVHNSSCVLFQSGRLGCCLTDYGQKTPFFLFRAATAMAILSFFSPC